MINNQSQKSKLSKLEIRSLIRLKRNTLGATEKKLARCNLLAQLENQKLLNKPKNIACFLSFDGEIPTQAVIQKICEQGKACYLPKLKPHKPNQLWFMPYQLDSKLTNNRFGIPEVDLLPNHAIAVSKLDLVLMPLVAFNAKGQRLGMGGGFYDATFAHLKNAKKRPLFIGLAYDFQMTVEIPNDPWDILLDGVCTPKKFYSFLRSISDKIPDKKSSHLQ